VAYAMSFVVTLVLDQFFESLTTVQMADQRAEIAKLTELVVGVICCYLSISFVLQTKDDVRFVIPYIEFSKETKGARPLVVDTSALIDGRISDVAATGILEGRLIVPRFVVQELQAVADSADKLKRNRGRRGLDVLHTLQGNKNVEVVLYDTSMHEDGKTTEVDQRLVNVAASLKARLLTTDFNLSKVAQLQSVDVFNLNDLSAVLKAVALPGERLRVRVVRPGDEPGQGVGFLDDGTMVVIDQARDHIDAEVEFTVTKLLQTSAGRMVFGRIVFEPGANAAASRSPQSSLSGQPPAQA